MSGVPRSDVAGIMHVAPAHDGFNPHGAVAVGVQHWITEGGAGMDDFFQLRLDFLVAGQAGRGTRRVINEVTQSNTSP